MKTYFWKYFILALFSITLLLLVSTPASAAERMEPFNLKVVSSPYLSDAPLFIAEEEGFFAEQHLNVEISKLDNATEAIPTLTQSKIDVVGAFISIGTLNAIARGANIKYVADKGYIPLTGCSYVAFVASQKLVETGELKHPSQLLGRRFSINPATILGYLTEKLLEKGNLKINDIKIKHILQPVAVLEALKQGSIDITLISEPWVTRFVQEGSGALWIPLNELTPDIQWSFIIYGPSLLEKNPDAGRRFMVAYLKAVRQFHQGKSKRNLEIMAKHTGLDQDLLVQACWPTFRIDGKINLQSVLDFQAWAVKKGYMDRPATKEQLWDPSFVEYANKFLDSTKK